MTFDTGTRLGPYEVLAPLGAGGMGEVYLAEDARLGRKVALKILPADVVGDRERLHRFEREARAASALNHPNIITIHEIGSSGDAHFISTEYIEGETLRRRMQATRLDVEDVLDIAAQIAVALDTAHRGGIVHRDIKPENVMLRADGLAKVLDFGLAKLTETGEEVSDPEAATRSMVQTNPGRVMGTVSYMSPEQARGMTVDARTDVWSLGVVLYEMLAGRVPFPGETTSDVIAAILKTEPVALSRIAAHCPAELERILTKALRKDREERYTLVKDMLLDLKSLKRRLEFEAELVRSAAPDRPEILSQPSVAPKVPTTSGGNKDALLLTEFTNLTGDAVFDGTLKMALAVTLEQSPFLDIFAETKVRQTLRLMGRSPDEIVTRQLGREICQRQGLKAFIAGTIASLGTLYVLTLEAVNAQTGETLGRQLEQAESKEAVLKALGQAATGLREKLGESLISIERFDAPLELTTSSLEALKVYSLAYEQTLKGKMLEAIPFYKQAVELDQNFAYAYGVLAVQYANTNQPKLAAEYAAKAFELRDRVSELEKLRITYFYYSYITGELDRAIETLELYKRTYPRDERATLNLSDVYHRIGRSEKAIDAAREALRLNPNSFIGYANLAEPLLRLNRFTEVKEICERVFELKLDSGYFHLLLYPIAFIENDAAAMRQHLAWFGGRPDEYIALNLQTETAASRGEWRQSQDFSRRAIDLANRNGARGVAARCASEQALRIVFWSSGTGLPRANDNQLQLALKTQTQKALSLERNKVTLTRSALALAVAGQTSEADKLTRELKTAYPKDTLINHLWLPTIEAAAELQSGKPEESIETLETAERFERAAEFYPQYIRGLAYLRLNEAARAATEFDKILARRGESPLSSLYPLAQLGEARATKAGAEYEKFFEMWRDADKDMPLLIAARNEFENLG